MTHQPTCHWERTTSAECEYRATHNYCPHPEHACDCPPVAHYFASLDEADSSFDLYLSAINRGTRMWRAERPSERELIAPDTGNLVAWLLALVDRAEAAVSLRSEAMILREVLGQLRPSIRDKVEGVALRLERGNTLAMRAAPKDAAE